MSATKNFYNKNVPSKNLVTTISGIIVLVISALSLFGVITAEQATGLTQYATTIVSAVSGIILMFVAVDPVPTA